VGWPFVARPIQVGGLGILDLEGLVRPSIMVAMANMEQYNGCLVGSMGDHMYHSFRCSSNTANERKDR